MFFQAPAYFADRGAYINYHLNMARTRLTGTTPVIRMSHEDLADEIIGITPLLKAYAVVLTKSSTNADDLVQDTLERAWRHRSDFKSGSSLKAWLFSILRNRFTDEFRKSRRTVQDVGGDNASKLVTLPDQHWRLQYSDLIRAIDSLRPDVRDALLLVSGAGLSHEEAAEVLGCPLGTLKSRIRRARSQLLDVVEIEPGRVRF